jgi:hypothetical protein
MLKKILKYTTLVFLAIALIATGLVYAFSEKIEKKVIAELTKELAVDVKVSGYKVIFWRTFPNIGIRLDNVRIEESYPIFNQPFIEAERLYFQFNLRQVLRGEYSLRKLQLYEGVCRLGSKDEGENFHFLKSDNEDSSKGFEINLSSISIQNTVFHFRGNDSTELYFDFNRIKAKGKISSDKIEFEALAKGDCKKLLTGETNWPLQREFNLDADFNYDFTKSKLKIKQGDLKIGASSFDTKGYFIFDDKDSVNLTIRTHGNKISTIVGLLPSKYNKDLSQYESDGFFATSVFINGEMSETKSPDIEAVVQIENGYVKASDKLSPMENIQLDARLLIGNHKSKLEVKKLSLTWDKQPIQSEFVLNDFDNPDISGRFKGILNLKQLSHFFKIEDWQMTGSIKADFSVKGKLKDFANNRFYQNTGFKGEMNWVDLSLSHHNNEVFPYNLKNMGANWKFDNNNIETKRLTFEINKSPFTISVTTFGLFQWLMDQGKLKVNTHITGNQLEWFNLTSNKKAENKEVANNSFLEQIEMHFQADIEKFIYDNLKISGMRLSAFYTKDFMELRNFSGRIAEGMFSFKGSVSRMDSKDDKWIVRADIQGSQLNIRTFFESFKNFGQEEITSENLSGRLTFDTKMALIIQSNLSWKKEDLYCFTDIKIENGQLLNYEPMQSLSSFAEVDELKNIKFLTLTNTFEVKDGEVNFPYMDIGNNILNMRIKGKHMFDNYMDYTVRVRLSDGLAAKYNIRSRRNADEIEDLKENGVALFINIKGYPDNLKFTMQKIGGKPELVQQFGTEWKSGRQELKETVREEFTKKGREEKDIKKAEKEEVEWDE